MTSDTDKNRFSNKYTECLRYWRKGEPVQNFGDYLSEYIANYALIFPITKARVYRLLGSCIHSNIIRDDLGDSLSDPREKVAFWGCGLRDGESAPSDLLDRCLFFGVRGALTRDALSLPPDTCLGDPGFIMPLLYNPSVLDHEPRLTLCMPHFNEKKTDEEIMDLTGVDGVLRPNISSSLTAIEVVVDRIAGARFLLTGSLHGAVIACAYNVPFAYWDSGWIDIPFKWHDLSSSLNVGSIFVKDLQSGMHAYETLMKPSLRKPDLTAVLRACPFYVRPEVMLQSTDHDQPPSAERRANICLARHTGNAISIFAANLEKMAFRMEEISAEHIALRVEMGRISSGNTSIAKNVEEQLGVADHEISILGERQQSTERAIESLSGVVEREMGKLNSRQGVTEVAVNSAMEELRAAALVRHQELQKCKAAWENAMLERQSAQATPAVDQTGSAVQQFVNSAEREAGARAEAPANGGASNWVLLAEYRIPMPENNSASFRMFQILKIIIDLGYKVFIISAHTLEQYQWVVRDRSELAIFENRLRELGVGYVFGREAAVNHLTAFGERYRCAILSYHSVAHEYLPFIRAFCPRAKVLFDCNDLHSVRLEREAKVKQDTKLEEEAVRYRRIEALLFSNADATISISKDEERKILAVTPEAKTFVIPNIHVTKMPRCGFKERHGILFLGHYLHSPNVDAVKFFAEQIFPTVRARVSGAQFLVVGSNMTDEVRSVVGDGIQLVGYVHDLDPIFETSRVFVAPLRYGAGVKGKVGQSLGFGLPVVTTSIGAEGLNLVNGETALIADDPRSFSDAVVRLYNEAELWNRLSKNGIQHISSFMSVEAVSATVRDLLATS